MSPLQNQAGADVTLAALRVGQVVQVTTWDEQPNTGDPTERRGMYLGFHAREGCKVLLPYGDEGGWRVLEFPRNEIRRVEGANDVASQVALLLQRLKNFTTFSGTEAPSASPPRSGWRLEKLVELGEEFVSAPGGDDDGAL